QPGFDLPADTRSPSSHAIANEQAAALAQALARLPEHYRAVIVWRHQEGRSFAEIGEQTGRTAEAARKLWARALLEVKKELGPSPGPRTNRKRCPTSSPRCWRPSTRPWPPAARPNRRRELPSLGTWSPSWNRRRIACGSWKPSGRARRPACPRPTTASA